MIELNKRAQASIEYLSTYGWALLVIALVLVALAWLGVFTPGQAIEQHCSFPINTLECNDYRVTRDSSAGGIPKLTLLEVTNNFGRTIHICGIQCSAAQPDPSTGLPQPPISTMFTDACQAGMTDATGEGTIVAITLEPGQRMVILRDAPGLYLPKCYNEQGAASEMPVGYRYTGKIYIAYSFDGETSGASRLLVGDLISAVQAG
ncbi:hypothetical protein DRN67_02765 [Candidatus Micrarchaeota archaeon]|nr:MAG: hypothetical protein DRN67_02765 [Candidatus Micrarchaeota archaeon]